MVPYILTLGISCGLAVIVERFPDLFRKKYYTARQGNTAVFTTSFVSSTKKKYWSGCSQYIWLGL